MTEKGLARARDPDNKKPVAMALKKERYLACDAGITNVLLAFGIARESEFFTLLYEGAERRGTVGH